MINDYDENKPYEERIYSMENPLIQKLYQLPQYVHPADREEIIGNYRQRLLVFGLRVLYFRKLRNISIKKLAEMTDTHHYFIEKIQKGKNPVITHEEYIAIAKALNVTIQQLIPCLVAHDFEDYTIKKFRNVDPPTKEQLGISDDQQPILNIF